MPPSADDIQNKRFLTALRGYDKDDVHSYLQEIAAHVRALEEALASPHPTAAQAEAEEPAPAGDHMAALLRQAANAADDILRDAAEGARVIRAEAERSAQRRAQEGEARGSLARWATSRWHREPPPG
jgi:DivIVA domain-containing protein